MLSNQRTIKLFEIDAFTAKPGRGNRAGVVFQSEIPLSDKQMASIAIQAGHSETAFVSVDGYDGNILLTSVRFFTKAGIEVPMCGHATLALNFLLRQQYFNSLKHASSQSDLRIIQRSPAGTITLRAEAKGRVVMELGSIALGETLDDDSEWRIALGIEKHSDSLPTRIAGNSGNRFVLVDIGSIKSVNLLAPDLSRVTDLSLQSNVIGLMAYSTRRIGNPLDRRHLNVSRVFVPAVGIPEDPVTGMANAALAAYLHFLDSQELETSAISQFFAAQGRPGYRGVIELTASCGLAPEAMPGSRTGVTSRVLLFGSAVIAGERELFIS